METEDGKIRPNISLVKILPEDHPRYRARAKTTFEEFNLIKGKYELLSGFLWKNDDFSAFDVFRGKQEYARGARRYFFVPKHSAFHFRGNAQPIVFGTPLARSLDSKEFKKDGPNVTAQVSLTPTIQFFQFFIPRLVPSDQWIGVMEKSAKAIETRLYSK